jgi:regulator of RNase E activity RraA
MHMTQLWKDDDMLFGFIREELYTAVIGDIMDEMGFHDQFLPPRITALHQAHILAGRAMTVREEDINAGISSKDSPDTFGRMLDALDDLKKNEVYVCSGASPHYALWGELMTLRAQKLQAAGAVLHGYLRDKRAILQTTFPVFSFGSYGQDQAPRGRVVDFRCPIFMERVRINPGDIVVGDMDGVCIVPQHVEQEVFTRALEKVRGEKKARTELLAGMSARAVFEKYHIL